MRSSARSASAAGRSTRRSSGSAARRSRASTPLARSPSPRTPARWAGTTSGAPSSREVLHVERRGFTVDGQEGVKDPLGMSALRLEVEAHIVTAPQTAVQNLMKCVAQAGVKIDELVVNALAAAEAVANETERELGVAVADVGAGTIDIAMFN